MNNVVNIEDHRPHISGEAVCTACASRWQAAAPVGVWRLECPGCGTENGLWASPIAPRGDVWVCGCGSDLFYMLPTCCQCRQRGQLS